MNELLIEYGSRLLNSAILAIFLFLISDVIGSFILIHAFKLSDSQRRNPFNVFIGVSFLVSVFSIIYFSLITTQLVIFGLFVYFIFKNKNTSIDKLAIYNVSKTRIGRYLIDISVLLFFILLRFWQLADKDYPELNTENCDMYNYLDNMLFQQLFRQENIFIEFESKFFGLANKYSLYHNWEYNLGNLLNCFWQGNNYTFFQLFLLPFLLGISIVTASRFFASYFKISYAICILVTLVFFTHHRGTNFFFTITKPFHDLVDLNFLYIFPFQAISDAFFLYPVSYVPKISVLILCVIPYLYAVKLENSDLRIFAIAFAGVANISYLPFFLVVEFIFLLSLKQSLKNFFIHLSAVPAIFITSFIINGYNSNIGAVDSFGFFSEINFYFSFKNLYHQYNNFITYSFGNFFSIILYLALILLVLRKGYSSLFFFLLAIIFPFIFYSYDVFGKVFALCLAGILFYAFYRIRDSILKHEIILVFIFSAVLCMSVVYLMPFLLESFQIKQNIIIVLFSVVPAYFAFYFIKQSSLARKNYIVVALSIVCISNNIHSSSIYFNRIFYPGTSKKFVTDFLNLIPDTGKLRGVYLTKFGEPLYPYTSRPGFNIQNYTDSLFITCASVNMISKSDSMEMIRKNLLERHKNWPFNKYIAKYASGKSFEDQLLGFIRYTKSELLFVNSGFRKPPFLNSYINDSLYCRQFSYWVYTLDQKKLNLVQR